jgi:membrane protein required for colicin V production
MGVWKGAVVQLAQVLSLLLGVYGAYKFSYLLAILMYEWGVKVQYVGKASFVCAFILVALGVALLGRVVHRLVQAIMLGWLNRLAGAVLSAFKAVFLISVALQVLTMIDCMPVEQTKESKLYQPLACFSSSMCKYMDINKLKNAAHSIDEEVDGYL